MSEQLYTMAGTRFFISDKQVNGKGEITPADFAGTNWVEVRGLYNVGELGGEQTINSFELLNEVWARKTKGGRDGGTLTNQFIPMALDAGQKKFLEAIESCRPYQFKIERGADCAPESTVTITTADPAVVSWPGHGFEAGQPVVFSNAGGALPTGLTAGTVYYVIAAGLTTNAFSVGATADATEGIETTAAGSGVNTATAPPAGMTNLFQGLASDGAKSGGAKNDLYTQTWNVAVDGRVLTV